MLYIYNTGLIYLVYNTYYRQALSYLPMGDGEFIYYGFNFNSVYSEITTMMDNILETTLANKDQGPNWIRMQPNSGTTAGGILRLLAVQPIPIALLQVRMS